MAKELFPQDIEYLVVHCSDSPPDRGDTAADINRWHIKRGFDLIGYHKVILPSGEVQNGRPEYVEGAHCRGYNSSSLAVCLIGIDYFTPQQFEALGEVLKRWRGKHPNAEIVGHCDLDPRKTCPNFDVGQFVEDYL